MKYLIQQNGYYYFRRKIPSTAKNFTFSLKTKNAKIATKIVALFLHKSASIFLLLKNEKGISVMDNLYKIEELLEGYKKEALLEYSQIEKERHKQFVCTSKKGKKRDGGHPKCIEKWLKILQETVYGIDAQYSANELFGKIFPRTNIDKVLVDSLSEEEKEIFKFKVIKNEASILFDDLERARNRFSSKSDKPSLTPTNLATPIQTNKYYEKTIQEIADDFFKIKEDDTNEMHKYKEPFEIFINVVDKKYFIDVTAEDMQDVVYVMKKLPSKTSKGNQSLYDEFKNDYKKLADYVTNNDVKAISLTTAQYKLQRLGALFDYAVDVERLDKNRLKSKHIMPTKSELRKSKDTSGETRMDFKTIELNTLFRGSSWYNKKLHTYLIHEQDRVYIPLIGLLSGMRLNEIAQLYLNDICDFEGIQYFRVDKLNPDQRLKTPVSRRNIPIHSKLIELGFLDYCEKLQQAGEERVFPQLFHTKDKGFGQSFSKKFNNKNFKSEWIEAERLNNPRLKVDFHSFRHTFSTKISSRVEDSLMDALLGHEGSSENKKRYDHKEIKILKEGIEKLDIADIDFSHMQEAINSIKQ